MKRTFIYVAVTVAVVVSSVGVYHVLSTSEYVSETQGAEASDHQDKPQPGASPRRPDHGNFQKRFEPKPPPADGGRAK